MYTCGVGQSIGGSVWLDYKTAVGKAAKGRAGKGRPGSERP